MSYLRRTKTDLIVVHCSAEMFGDAEQIDGWHKNRGWKGVGYHHVILNGLRRPDGEYEPSNDGLIEKGREEDEVGAHEKTSNSRSVGICLIGDHWFTWRQFEVLSNLLRKLRAKYPEAKVVGHRDTRGGAAQGKTCPNFVVADFLCKCG